VIEPENSDALMNALCCLATNPELARKMGRHGREYIVRKFSRSQTAEKYIQCSNICQNCQIGASLPLRLDRSADQNFGVFGFPIPIYNGN
jgi:hypothetical protein